MYVSLSTIHTVQLENFQLYGKLISLQTVKVHTGHCIILNKPRTKCILQLGAHFPWRYKRMSLAVHE